MQFISKVPQCLHLKNVISLQKDLDVLSVRSSSLHQLCLTSVWWQSRMESDCLKKWLSSPLKQGHWSQWCSAASSHSRPHPELIEVNFIADFVGTDSSSPSLCQCAFKIPSAVLHPRTPFHKFRSGRLQKKCSCDKQVMIKGWVLFITLSTSVVFPFLNLYISLSSEGF